MENNIIEFWKTDENAITCYKSRPNLCIKTRRPVDPKKVTGKGVKLRKKVIVESQSGEIKEYESVFEASKAVLMNYNTLIAFLNGRAKNPTKYKIYKS
jgi:hypothetical protein